jgi:hypothetical protein
MNDPSLSSVERRKKDLVDLANFGARTGRRWLVRDALLADGSQGYPRPRTSARRRPRSR